jgi:Predicted esterase
MCISFGHQNLERAANANPGEIPAWFWPLALGMVIAIPLFIFWVLVYAFGHNRKQPLLFGLFEEGFVVVLRNKQLQKIFWDDIRRIYIKRHRKKQSQILAIGVETSPIGQTVGINTEFFRDSRELCRRIIDSSSHAEKVEPTFNLKRFLVLFLIFIIILAGLIQFVKLCAQYMHASRLSTKWQIESKMTGETMHFSVYLPPGYEREIQNGRRFPVLYLLHGFRDDHTSWPRHGELRRIADKTIASGNSVPMIIVMPHAWGGFYGNRDENYRYEDYFFTELIPFVEKQFKVRADKEHRAIAGISMGGQGAFYYAMKYPDMFGSCCPMGGAFHFPNRTSESLIAERSDVADNENDLAALLRKTAERHKNGDPDERQKTFVRFYFDCGEQDGLIKINRELDAEMAELDIPHEFRSRPGGHSFDCWRNALPEVFEFVSVTFRE